MSEFGAFMLMVAAILCLLALIKFLAWLTELQERGGIGAAIRQSADRYVVRRESVRAFREQEKPAMPVPVMSTPTPPPDNTSMILVYTTDDLIRAAAKLTYAQRIAVLAALRDDDKKPYSANKIVAFLGGDRNEILASIRETRPADDAPYTTPIAGRATAAQFETEPELRYQPPPR